MKPMIAILIALVICGPVAGQTSPTQKNGAPAAATSSQPSAQASAVQLKEEDCGCDVAPPDVVATVNGVKITAKEIEDPLKDAVSSLRKQAIEARGRELYLQVNSRLLDAEAKKRGTTQTKLLEQEVISKVGEPTEQEAQAFYNKNRVRIQGEFKEVKAQIIDYLRNQRQGEEAKKFADRLRATADVKVLVEKAAPPANDSNRAQPLAIVNGLTITSGDLEDALRPLVFNVQEQIYKLRKQQLDMAINTALLEQEAQKRKVTATVLLEAEVKPKAKTIADDEVKKFYEENKEKIGATFTQVKDSIKRYLEQKEEHSTQGAFAQQLRREATIQVFLTAPDPPEYAISTEDQPWKGELDAPVTIVMFTDFECQSCAQTRSIIERLLAEYVGQVKLFVRDFPLEKHANAFKAAEAAEAAHEQGKYWHYAPLLYQNQSVLTPENLKTYATQIGLDRKKFDDALDSGRLSDKVRRDLQDGLKLGVNATPAVFINGRLVRERTYDFVKAAIETALARKQKESADGNATPASKSR